LSRVHLLEDEARPALGVPLVHVGHHRLADVNVGEALVADVVHLLAQLRVATADHQHLESGGK